MEALKEGEKLLLEKRSRPLRSYINSNVAPHLTNAIIEICKERPEDPVDFLVRVCLRRLNNISIQFRFNNKQMNA